jgi:cation diffusion facilitator family transporter
MNDTEVRDSAIRVSTLSIIINVALSVGKLVSGLVANSSALVSDAVHSASDVVSTIVVMVGINVSSKRPDKEHPYGHERLESISALLLSIILCATGFMIGVNGIKNVVTQNFAEITSNVALISAVASILVKEWQYRYTRNVAKRINSDSLMADAWHHRSDALSSVGSSIGIIGTMLGVPIMDSLASMVICVFIVKAGADIMKEAIDRLVDKSCDDATIAEIQTVIVSQEGVKGIDELKTRLFGSKIYIDVTILIDGNTILRDAHAIAENVHDRVEATFPNIKHCMIHIHPFQ